MSHQDSRCADGYSTTASLTPKQATCSIELSFDRIGLVISMLSFALTCAISVTCLFALHRYFRKHINFPRYAFTCLLLVELSTFAITHCSNVLLLGRIPGYDGFATSVLMLTMTSMVPLNVAMLIRRINIQEATIVGFISETATQRMKHRNRMSINLFKAMSVVCCLPGFMSAFSPNLRTPREHLMNFFATTVFASTSCCLWDGYVSFTTVRFFWNIVTADRISHEMYEFKRQYHNALQSFIVYLLFGLLSATSMIVMIDSELHAHNFVALNFIISGLSCLGVAISLMVSLRRKHKETASKVFFFSY